MYINGHCYAGSPSPRRPPVTASSPEPASGVPVPGVVDSQAGRKPTIVREDLIAAALRLTGAHRSVSTLSLREVAREAGIAPNSFYRQFHDMDELAVELIDLAGESLRRIVGDARRRAVSGRSVVRGSLEAFMERLRADDKLLHVLLREGTVGSDAFKRAVDRQLLFFEEELHADLVRIAAAQGLVFHEPGLVARAITRLVFAMGGTALDSPPDRDAALVDELSHMIRMLLRGAHAMGRARRKR
ncbi:HTH-type transcriptional repressor FabR [Luteimonas chenhongjianii]|uniref:HTH-type transcriptional repressor FabR n=1 Tax=Luteimonas chenhongjianii TaxID=2006110 RepID=A0A290XFP8_9GAMM|nr:HTH-type transcriptional repressor FabR [Luteimonas chenhongjianii]